MNKTPKLWELLAALIPVMSGIVIWLWNLAATVKTQGKDIEYLQQDRIEYKADIKAISEKLNAILIRLENKKDRD